PASRGDGAGWEETEPDGKPSMPNRAELAAFLRRRPHRLHPADVGLPGTGPRRTPGLRRQEVAQLAGISVDYYIRLEQGRGSHPSRQVLGALARAFMLTADERDYLFRTAGELPPHLERPTSTPPEAVRHLLDAMDGVPAYVVDAKGDVVAWNRLARHFVGDLDQAPPERRNLLRWIFGHAAADPAWDDEHTVAFAAAMVADLRAAYGRYSGDPGIEALVDELLAASDRFADMWSARAVQRRRPIVKRVDHPELGPLEFECQLLDVPGTGQRLIAYCAAPGSPTREAFRRLQAEEPPGTGTAPACTAAHAATAPAAIRR